MISIKYYGIEGEGRNVTEAKRDAGAKIERALSGTYTPVVIVHGDWTAIVAREPISGWGYRLVDTSKKGLQHCYLGGTTGDFEATINSVARHLAQLAGHYNGIERHLSRADMAHLDAYNAWQNRFMAAKIAGHTEDECRSIADQNA